MPWMAWTLPTAILFAVLIGAILAMLIWELVSPTVSRKGFLPMPTTRGDRLFLSLLTAAFIHMAWLGLTMRSPWWATAISVVAAAILGRWG